MRARYHRLVAELRCPQCMNTNLAGSDGIVARDLRREVHRQLLAGRSDREILDYMRNRYGDFVLYRPRLTYRTLFIWLGPALLLLVGLAWLTSLILRHSRATPALSGQERRRLSAILRDAERGDGR